MIIDKYFKEMRRFVLRDKHMREDGSKPKIVSIGECGFDSKSVKKNAIMRDYVFPQHFDIARVFKFPMYFTSYRTEDDLMYDMLKDEMKNVSAGGIIRNLDTPWKDIKKYLDLGLYIGLNKHSIDGLHTDAIKKIPLDRIILESECPFCRLILYDPKKVPKDIS